MPTDTPLIAFAAMTPADYPMLQHWLENPPMNEWWGDPAGYIQYWSVGNEVDSGHGAEAPWLLELPRTAVGVDLSLGRPELLGRGIGTAVLRAFLARLFAEGHETVVIDPDEANSRAIRAYEKVGFREYGRYPHGSGVTVLMTITSERFAEIEG
ncbi:GNAT family N-acetyltransferase [Oricola indica]|uniref:GNAT family N-acetyltransferase n=1 Tax=Oricola indica TaxID=2872591 RepID=UPI003CCBD884